MSTLGWLSWRSIWAPPKGSKAATVPWSVYKYVTQPIVDLYFCRSMESTNIFYILTTHSLATDHAKKHASARSRNAYYPTQNSIITLPATTQPWVEWSAEMQWLTERMRLAKPNVHSAQVLNHLFVLRHQHTVVHMKPYETDLEGHSSGVQHMRSSSCWVVFATVPECHFGSGSGSRLNHCQIGGPGG